jgi:hypothetical protein
MAAGTPIACSSQRQQAIKMPTENVVDISHLCLPKCTLQFERDDQFPAIRAPHKKIDRKKM